MKMHKSVNTIN